MERLPVLNKADMAMRYRNGEFGNASPTWNDIQEFLAADINRQDLFHIRSRTPTGKTFYDVRGYKVETVWRGLADKSDYYISAMCPTEKTLFQGEVVQTSEWSRRCGLDLHYSTVKKPMRDALREKSQTVSGIIAQELLRYFLCPNSYEWLMFLLDAYPYHVVEFTTLSTRWGTLAPRFNTLFWEVRYGY